MRASAKIGGHVVATMMSREQAGAVHSDGPYHNTACEGKSIMVSVNVHLPVGTDATEWFEGFCSDLAAFLAQSPPASWSAVQAEAPPRQEDLLVGHASSKRGGQVRTPPPLLRARRRDGRGGLPPAPLAPHAPPSPAACARAGKLVHI